MNLPVLIKINNNDHTVINVKIYAVVFILHKHASGGTKCGGSLQSAYLYVGHASLPGHCIVMLVTLGQ